MNRYRNFEPKTYTNIKSSIRYLFPVPEADAVGTLNSYNNSITAIILDKNAKKPRLKVIAKDFSKMVAGNYTYSFSQNFADDIIIYAKTRAVVICNVRTGEAYHAETEVSSDDYLAGIAFLDRKNNLFAIVKSADHGGDWLQDYLHIAKLEGKRLADLGSVMKLRISRPSSIFPDGNNWLVHNGKLIGYDHRGPIGTFDGTKDMLCFDGINRAAHPFTEIFNANKEKLAGFEVRGFALHPKLPFGLAAEHILHLDPLVTIPFVHPFHIVRWDTDDPEKQFVALTHKLIPFMRHLGLLSGIPGKDDYFSMALAYLSFSPDGKWFVMGCFENNLFAAPRFIAIPVDKKYPEFIGIEETVILGQVEKIASAAWIAPAAFVASDGVRLYKWDLNDVPDTGIINFNKNNDY
ncbi:MAG: hypothetical protein FWB85_07185 [Chitinispirillia bacterium]|nr:hypothetical protein [Chitinispirillia bacterium]MCL2242031.1 hypothetical protein [Chitinispirillia bacterium]